MGVEKVAINRWGHSIFFIENNRCVRVSRYNKKVGASEKWS